MITAVLLVLMLLWLLGFARAGDFDFLRLDLFNIGGRAFNVLDTLIALAVIWLIVALRGPLAIAGSVLLILWGLSVAGVVVFEGIPLSALIIVVIIVGVTVHVLTRRPV